MCTTIFIHHFNVSVLIYFYIFCTRLSFNFIIYVFYLLSYRSRCSGGGNLCRRECATSCDEYGTGSRSRRAPNEMRDAGWRCRQVTFNILIRSLELWPVSYDTAVTECIGRSLWIHRSSKPTRKKHRFFPSRLLFLIFSFAKLIDNIARSYIILI